MPGGQIVGGLIQFKVDGKIYAAKGNFTWNPGLEKREGVVGSDAPHGFKALPQIPFVEGEITDKRDTDTVALLNATDATVYLGLANGKAFVLRNAWHAGEGTHNTEEGNLPIRFEGMSGEVVPA